MRQMKKLKCGQSVSGNPGRRKLSKVLELKERSEVVEILRQRLASRNRNKGRPAEDFFNEFFAKNNIPVED